MRKLLGALLVLAVLAGALLGVDRYAHGRTEEELTAGLAGYVEGNPRATVHGFPFLTQVAAGRLEHVSVAADGWSDGTLRLEDIRAEGYEVTTTEPYRAGRARASAVVPADSLQALVDGLGLPLAVEVGREGDRLTLAPTQAPAVRLALEVVPAGRAVELRLTDAALGGFTVSLGDLGIAPSVRSRSVPLDMLPEGLTVDAVDVLDDGVRVRLSGRDVLLEVPPS